MRKQDIPVSGAEMRYLSSANIVGKYFACYLSARFDDQKFYQTIFKMNTRARWEVVNASCANVIGMQ
jgi:hypothetical protein